VVGTALPGTAIPPRSVETFGGQHALTDIPALYADVSHQRADYRPARVRMASAAGARRGLARLSCFAIFDVEDGVKFYTTVAGVEECLPFIVSLAGAGVRLWDVGCMERWGGESALGIWVPRGNLGTVPGAEPVFTGSRLGSERTEQDAPWAIPPGWAETHRQGPSSAPAGY
jgi:hypothetical protein